MDSSEWTATAPEPLPGRSSELQDTSRANDDRVRAPEGDTRLEGQMRLKDRGRGFSRNGGFSREAQSKG